MKNFFNVVVILVAVGFPVATIAATCASQGGDCSNETCVSPAVQAGNEGDYDDCQPDEVCCVESTVSTVSGSDSGGSSSDSGGGQETVNLDNPLTSDNTDPAYLIGLIIKSALGLVGGVALVMTVYGGFQWLTSAGSAEKVKKGTATMIWSVIGLILVLGSYLLLQNILNFIGGK